MFYYRYLILELLVKLWRNANTVVDWFMLHNHNVCSFQEGILAGVWQHIFVILQSQPSEHCHVV